MDISEKKHHYINVFLIDVIFPKESYGMEGVRP